MIQNQQSMNLSPYMGIYDLIVPKDNMLRRINDIVDFSFVYDELAQVVSQEIKKRLNDGREFGEK